MRKLKDDTQGWTSVFIIVIVFVSFLMVSSFYLTGDDPFKDFNQNIGNVTVSNREPWKFDILNPVYSILDLLVFRTVEIVVNFFSAIGELMFDIVWQFITLDIPILNALSFVGFVIKIIIWMVYAVVILQLLPFVG